DGRERARETAERNPSAFESTPSPPRLPTRMHTRSIRGPCLNIAPPACLHLRRHAAFSAARRLPAPRPRRCLLPLEVSMVRTAFAASALMAALPLFSVVPSSPAEAGACRPEYGCYIAPHPCGYRGD